MPGAAYIVSSMSSISRRTSSSTASTGLDFFLRRGSGAVRMGNRAMVPKYAAKSGDSSPSALHHGAQASLGEDLQQQGMGNAAVEDRGRLDAAVHRIDAVFDLGNHAAGNRPVGDQVTRLLDRHLVDE